MHQDNNNQTMMIHYENTGYPHHPNQNDQSKVNDIQIDIQSSPDTILHDDSTTVTTIKQWFEYSESDWAR